MSDDLKKEDIERLKFIAERYGAVSRALDAATERAEKAEGKALAYDDLHRGDWLERAHALAQKDARDAGRNVWHIAVERAEKAEADVRQVNEAADAACEMYARRVQTALDQRDEAVKHRDLFRASRADWREAAIMLADACVQQDDGGHDTCVACGTYTNQHDAKCWAVRIDVLCKAEAATDAAGAMGEVKP